MTSRPQNFPKRTFFRRGIIVAIFVIAIICVIIAAHSALRPSDVEIEHIDQLVLARAKAKYADCYIIREPSHYKIRKIGDVKTGIFYYRIKADGGTIMATAYWTITGGSITIDKMEY